MLNTVKYHKAEELPQMAEVFQGLCSACKLRLEPQFNVERSAYDTSCTGKLLIYSTQRRPRTYTIL